jgi:hypothetical protein
VKLVRHSRPKGGATDRPSRNARARRPERFPERGLKERSTWLLRNGDSASGEPRGESPMAGTKSRLARWQGRLRLNGVVGVLQTHAPSFDLICRTAVYVTRTHGGVGGGSREASPYPD